MKLDLPDPVTCASCGEKSSLEDVMKGNGKHFYLMWLCNNCKNRMDEEVRKELESLPF